MDYERKYKEALERAKNLYSQHWVEWRDEDIESIFPELKESGGDRIRRALVDGFKRYDDGALFNGCLVREILPWLEKQGEQKPAWSEEDDEKFRDVIRLVEQGAPVQSMRDHYTNWLKSLKERLKGD